MTLAETYARGVNSYRSKNISKATSTLSMYMKQHCKKKTKNKYSQSNSKIH